MNSYRFIIVFLFVISFNVSSAQNLSLTDKDYKVKSTWMVGLGYNFVDDSGSGGKGLFDIKDNWNSVAFPSRISIGRYFNSGLGIEGIASYNKYKVGKMINGAVNATETDYLAFDARLSYDLNKIIGETGFFDPYVGVGLGYADVNDDFRGTYNAVVGFRTWFSDRVGLDFSSSGKWGMGDKDNHLQHHAGVVYRFGIEKGLSKKGMQKLALINENQRVQDSINAAKKAEEEARLLAERLAREKEQARLAAEEKAKRDAENQRRANIEKQVKDVGNVGFAFNSSAVSKAEKERLDKLAAILQANPTVTLKISSHADARGSQEYNMKLTEKRVKNTIDYMIKEHGIDASRLDGEAFGKKQLLNDCDGTKPCPESKHRVNRRSEFEVVNF
ncbi:OmpA family protein [Arenibacter lacus]|uniref:OmpA family protein n=1 Tax=Arenibacter lacus TaxID=2608629 RepID=UPI00123CEA73|nr:OmpA family protein [Arenibacter lacus]